MDEHSRLRRSASAVEAALGPEAFARVTIDSVIRGLVTAVVVCSALCVLLFVVGLAEVAVPFLLAATIGFGLIVVSATWRALTRAHPGSG
jgi:urea transporter